MLKVCDICQGVIFEGDKDKCYDRPKRNLILLVASAVDEP